MAAECTLPATLAGCMTTLNPTSPMPSLVPEFHNSGHSFDDGDRYEKADRRVTILGLAADAAGRTSQYSRVAFLQWHNPANQAKLKGWKCEVEAFQLYPVPHPRWPTCHSR